MPTNRRNATRHQQRGIALLVLMVAVALASVGVLLERLNTGATSPETDIRLATRMALQEAREVLLGASVGDVVDGGTLSARPGQLPWPDRPELVDPDYDGWSDCVNGPVVGAANLLGRFPYLGEVNLAPPPLVCNFQTSSVRLGSRIVDGSGEPLWYAVSRNLLHTDTSGAGETQLVSINPDIVRNPPYGWLRVCDTDGNLLSDRVAAVIIAPGTALTGQDRSGVAPAAVNFLDAVQVADPVGGALRTISNADSDGGPDSVGLTTAGLCGSGTNADEQFVVAAGTNAVDSATFNDELVFITADEVLDAVQQRALSVAANALEAYRANHAGHFPWLSPFINAANPTVENPTAIAASIVDVVDGYDAGLRQITLTDRVLDASLVGAPVRNTDNGATAVITNVQNVAGAGGLTDTVLSVSRIVGGSANTFAIGDDIEIALFREDAQGQTFEGQLPIDDATLPEDVVSDFTVRWDFSLDAAANGQPVQVPFANESATYKAAHAAFVRSSALTGVVVQANNGTVSGETGVCRIIADDANAPDLRCQGHVVRAPYLQVTHTSTVAPAPGALELHADSINEVDTGVAAFGFADWGIAPGDRVRVVATGTRGIIQQVGVGGAPARLSVFGFEAGGTTQFVDGDVVEVEPAATLLTGAGYVTTGGTATTLEDTAQDFTALQVVPGDVVVLDPLGTPSYGLITGIVGTNTLTVPAWFGNPVAAVASGTAYQIRSGFVASRRMEFDLYIAATNDFLATEVNDQFGTTLDVASIAADVVLPVPAGAAALDNIQQTIRTEDFDLIGRVVAESNLTLVAGMRGALAIDGITRHLQAGDGEDLPAWFVDNGWHQFIYVSMADDARPIGGSLDTGDACAPAISCVTVYRDRLALPAGAADELVAEQGAHAALVGAGAAIVVGGVLQPRTSSDPAEFFEGENVQNGFAHPLSVAGDRQFEFRPSTAQNTGFNDAVRILR